MKLKLFLTILLGLIIASCGNHTDPHIYFLQQQQKSIGSPFKISMGSNATPISSEKNSLGNMIYKYDWYRTGCIEVIEVNEKNIIVDARIEGAVKKCWLNQN